MLLEIKFEAEEIDIVGHLTKTTVSKFQDSFHKILNHQERVVINIQGLKEIDRDGVNAIAKLHNFSLNSGKKLSIVGTGCKELYQHFNSNDAA